MSRIFISYKRVDKDKVFKIKDQIESALGEKCWIDIDGIESDDVFATKIIGAINKSEVFLFMYSASHKLISDYENDRTIRELNYAQRRKKRIVLVNIDGSELSDWFELLFGTKQQVDGRRNQEITRMIKDLRKWLNIITVQNSRFDIFISYRRDGGAQYARILQLMLIQRGYKVFLDYDELSEGIFSDHIKEAINEAPVFMLVLSKGALQGCANEGDRVRLEILYAIEQNKYFVPVNPDNQFDGIPEGMPEEIVKVVGSHQHSDIGFGQTLGAMIELLIKKRIKPYVGSQKYHRSNSETIYDKAYKESPMLQYISVVNAARTFIGGVIGTCLTPIRIIGNAVGGVVGTLASNQSDDDLFRDACEKRNKCSSISYEPDIPQANALQNNSNSSSDNVDRVVCSVFAPSNIKVKKRLMVQVYLHLPELLDKVISQAQEADSKAERRKYKALSQKIRRGANIDIELVIENEEEVYRETQHLIWQPPFVECTFKYKVPADLPEEELSCDIHVIVNGIVVGRLSFLTAITDTPSQTNAEVLAIPTQCVFISYAHKDAEQVQFLAEGYRALDNLEYFFDRHKLKPGDEFESKIFESIDKSDLFILCWSKNAAESEWVTKERLYAFKKYIESKGGNSKRIRIYPVNIKPSADLPTDMGNILNFGQLI